MMKQDIKNKELRENQKYVSPSVKVIEVTAQKVLCGSGQSFRFDDDTFRNGDSDDPWI